MKHNRQSFWLIPLYAIIFFVISFFVGKFSLSSFAIFSISSLLLGTIIIFWNHHYFTSLEKTLYAFSTSHGGIVELKDLTKRGEIVCYDAIGNYYGRKFRIFTERIIVKGNFQMMTTLLKINSPIITTLKLKRTRLGKIAPNPSTSIATAYDIQFNIPPKSIAYIDSANFINLIDQQGVGTDLTKLGKKYRDYLNRFQIYTDGKTIGVKRCKPIRSKEDLESLMSSLSELAQIIEDISSK